MDKLGCFHVLAIVNSAAMNIGVHVSFQIIVFFGYMPRSGVAGSCGNSFVVFWGEPLCCSSQWLPQLTFPPTAGKNSQTFLVVDALTILRRTGVRDFVKLPSTGVCLLFFSLQHWGAGCGEEDAGEGPSHPSSWGDCCQPDSSPLVLTWVPGLRSCWSGVSTVDSGLPLPILALLGVSFFFPLVPQISEKNREQ